MALDVPSYGSEHCRRPPLRFGIATLSLLETRKSAIVLPFRLRARFTRAEVTTSRAERASKRLRDSGTRVVGSCDSWGKRGEAADRSS